jgi:hypothetical protein
VNNKLKALFLTLFFLTSSAFAFEGELTYEIEGEASSKNAVKSKIKIFIIESRLRIDFIPSSSQGNEIISAYLNYHLGVGHFVKNNSSKRIDLRMPFKSPDFLMPEEMTKTSSTKLIFESQTNEYETFYFINKHRLPLKVWYSTHTFPGKFYPVWQLFELQPDMILANYFVHQISRQIAYEMNFNTVEGKKMTYKLVKIDKKKPSDSSFEPP